MNNNNEKEPPTEAVELRPAYNWTCSNCGIDQFEHVIVPEMSSEQEDVIRLSVGLQEEDQGIFMWAPEEVECRECGTRYCVNFLGEDDDDDEPQIMLPDQLL